MIETRATIAIVRRHIDRRFAADWAMQFGLVLGLAYVFAPSFGYGAPAAIALLAATAGAESSHVRSLRRLTFFTVPLYGRQLARAHAIAPSLLALSLPLGFVVGASLRGSPPPATAVGVATLGTLVATLVSLSAVFRDGRDRALYIALAVAAGFSIAIPYALQPASFPALVALALGEGFFALRAFGETLARYDPLPH